MGIRTRFTSVVGPTKYWGLFNPASPTMINGGNIGAQLTVSEGHPWHMKPRPQGDIGGEFTSVSAEWTKSAFSKISTLPKQNGGLWTERVEGIVYPFHDVPARIHMPLPLVQDWSGTSRPSGVAFSTGGGNDRYPDLSSSYSSLVSKGTEAVDRVKPTNSIVSAATALGELKRDGVPNLPGTQLWKERTELARSAGSEYLNVQFGWNPMISDIKNFAKAASQSGKILSQLERDSGRLVRRRYEFPESRDVSVLEEGVGDKPSPSFHYKSYADGNEWGTRTTIRTVTRRRWFSGAFTYYLPTGGSAFDRVARGYLEFDKLFGGVLDPEIIWNLTPWSWATDWALNTGSVLSNLTDASLYGLVMPYGYMMETTIVKYQYRMLSPTYIGIGKVPLTAEFVHTTKRRVKANPFGFGISWDGLNSSQLAILAALGLSRSPRRAQ